MKRATAASALLLALVAAGTARAGTADDLRELYARFAQAQNARDFAGVRALLLDGPDFLWVSDGRSCWGPDRMIERMAGFQKAEVWRVVPDLARARVVELDPDAAYLHLPLELVIGAKGAPDHLRWLVSMLCKQTGQGWRIAALFTTADKG
jgi:ketosteroid isomerase-like protein